MVALRYLLVINMVLMLYLCATYMVPTEYIRYVCGKLVSLSAPGIYVLLKLYTRKKLVLTICKKRDGKH